MVRVSRDARAASVVAQTNLERTVRIWVDADACPNAIKEVLFRAAERVHVRTILVANQFVRTPAIARGRVAAGGSGF